MLSRYEHLLPCSKTGAFRAATPVTAASVVSTFRARSKRNAPLVFLLSVLFLRRFAEGMYCKAGMHHSPAAYPPCLRNWRSSLLDNPAMSSSS